MDGLKLETFLGGTEDPEKRQYCILRGLKEYRVSFHRTRLYPALSELVALHGQLKSFLRESDEMTRQFPHHLKGVDTEECRLVFEADGGEHADLREIIAVVRWALPVLEEAIEEGTAIYAFVEHHLSIEAVGIMPMYRDEGYWFVPEPARALLHLMRYEVSLYESSAGRYRTLKTRLLESVEQRSVVRSPESIKLSLIERYRDLPNPATYRCDTDLDLPYEETVLPVAKRKFMEHLFS